MRKTERKPIIETGSILSNVLQRDRQNSGREAPPMATHDEEPISQEAAPLIDLSANQQVSEPASKSVSQLTSKLDEDDAHDSKAVSKTPGLPADQQASKPVSLSKREIRQAAEALAESRLVTVSLKLPEGLNDWLDQYAFARRKQKVLKQDLVAKAIHLLYVELEGEG
jgi:hypothetical protein